MYTQSVLDFESSDLKSFEDIKSKHVSDFKLKRSALIDDFKIEFDELRKSLDFNLNNLVYVKNEMDEFLNKEKQKLKSIKAIRVVEFQDPINFTMGSGGGESGELDLKEPIEASNHVGKFFDVIDNIPEDSLYRKLFACVPLLGIISTVNNERSLRKKITEAQLSETCIHLINIKNHYKVASIVRTLLSVALVVVGIAFSILNRQLRMKILMSVGVVANCCISFYTYGIYKNKQLIGQLENSDEVVPEVILDLR